jgi:hypothetical protein
MRATVLADGVRAAEPEGNGTVVDHDGDMPDFRPPWVRVADVFPHGSTHPAGGTSHERGRAQVDQRAAQARAELEDSLRTYRRGREELHSTIAKATTQLDTAELVALIA